MDLITRLVSVLTTILMIFSVLANDEYHGLVTRLENIVSKSDDLTTDYISDFAHYVVKFGKDVKYSQINDLKLRKKYETFISTHLNIIKTNSKNLENYQLSHNQFSDWTINERKSIFMKQNEMSKIQETISIHQQCPQYIYELSNRLNINILEYKGTLKPLFLKNISFCKFLPFLQFFDVTCLQSMQKKPLAMFLLTKK